MSRLISRTKGISEAGYYPDASSASAAVSGQWQISTDGGTYPAWSPDGQELYYLDPAGNMMAAPIIIAADTVAVSTPELLFPTRISCGGAETSQGRQYDVAVDGRFLINTLVSDGAVDPITLILNWDPEVAQ